MKNKTIYFKNRSGFRPLIQSNFLECNYKTYFVFGKIQQIAREKNKAKIQKYLKNKTDQREK